MHGVKDITIKQALIFIGIIMLIVGIITGFLPVGGSCGSAFAGPGAYSEGVAACQLYRGEAIRSTWQLIIGGFLLVVWTATIGTANADQAKRAPQQVHGGPPREDV